MSNYVTDEELLKQLNGETAKTEPAPASADQGYVTDPELVQQLNEGYVTDPDLMAQLQNGPVEPTGGDLIKSAVGAVAPALSASIGPTGLPELAKSVGKAAAPVVSNAVKNTIASYAKNPIGAVADVALMGAGLPPAYGPVKGLEGGYDAIQSAKQVFTNVSQSLSKYPPETVEKAMKWINVLTPEDADKFAKLAEKDGIDKALKNFKAPEYFGEKATAALKATKDAVPSNFSKLGQVFGPVARAVGKVAGPAGIAMNAYDAGQMARETQLGERLARGEGKRAEQAFNNMVNKNISGYQPSPQEAKNLLDSGDERTINIYGGRKRLMELANPNAINSGYAQQLKALGK
jgi:hypothetical protein